MKCITRVLLFIIVILASMGAHSQVTDTAKQAKPTEVVVTNPKPKKDTTDKTVKRVETLPNQHYRTKSENLLTVLLLIFGLIVLAMAAYIISKFKHDVNHLFKYFIIILVSLYF